MSNYLSFLITIIYGESLLKCALKINRDKIPANVNLTDDYSHSSSHEYLHSKLPFHVQSCGPIVEVEPIFEIEIIT